MGSLSFFSGSTFNMVAGTLYTYPDNFRAQKALVAAKYSGADLKIAENFVFGETNKTPEFTKKFPLGKVPAFEGSDGTLLTESNAIAYYVANDELRGGSDAASRAQVVQWMCWADSEVLPASCTWVFPCMGIMQYNKSSTEGAKEDIKAALNQLNTHLLTKTFLVGERISLADIAVSCTMLNLFKLVLDPAFRKSYVNVTRWFTTVVNQPNVKAVVGSVALCTKMAEFDAKKYAEFSGKGKKEEKSGKGKKEEKKKEAKPESRKSSLSGIWIWRGQELCFDLCEDWQIDCYSYDWKKLDPTSEDIKAQVKQYFTHDEESKRLEGRAFNQGMILK